MTRDQAVAFGSIVIMTLWAGASLWYHLTHVAGAEPLEFVFLIVLTALLLGLSALYALRISWSYPAGILICLGLFAAMGKAVIDDTFFFSISVFNVSVMLALLAAIVAIVFSWRAFRENPPRRWWYTLLGVAGVVAIGAGLARVADANTELIAERNARLVLGRMERDLAEMQSLEERIEYVLEAGDLPSAALGIVVDDELVWAEAFGEGVDLDTVYNLGSIAKPIVATAVLQLYERGLIDLDADINDYLPFDVRHPDYPETPITPQMLLAHQSGLGHHTAMYSAYHESDELLDWEQAHRGRSLYGEVMRLESKPDFGTFLEGYLIPGGEYFSPQAWRSTRPGTGYGYSTPGYDLLGYVVEQVSGVPFDDHLQQNIFEPLGMGSTARLSPDPPFAQATPTERVYGVMWKTNVQVPIYGSERVGGGGLYSTVTDLAQFLIAHMNEGRVGKVQLLQPESVALMHAPSVETSADRGMVASGYGWARYRKAPWYFWGTPFEFYGAQGHGGGDIGYRARMWYVEKGKGGFGVIVLTNLANFFKPDDLWTIGTYLYLENLLLDEAQVLWGEKHEG